MKGIIFESPGKVVLGNVPDLNEDRTIIRNEYTLVSPGTELAILSGEEMWAPLPFEPGYASVGTVVRSGPECKFVEGTRVFTHGKHAEYTAATVLTVAVPERLDARKAVYARIATVSMTALRVAHVEIGDWVVIFGAGLVGNLAAQLCLLSGARVIVVDLNGHRLSTANRVGVHHCIAADGNEINEITSITGGEKCNVVIDATGVPEVIETGIDAAANGGTIVLLGTPRGEHKADVTTFLRTIHLSPRNVTLIGAHEWRYPVTTNGTPNEKHSIERNTSLVLELLRQESLQVECLTSRIASPADAPTVYRGLKNDPGNYNGVLFDWKNLTHD